MVFRLINVSLNFRVQSAKKTCLRFAIFNFSEKLQNIFEIGFKKIWSVRAKIAVIEKIFSKEKIRRQIIYVLIYPLSKFGGNRTNSLSFSVLQCPLQVKKLIREKSAKYVHQKGNFYFRPKLKTAISLPIFNLFQ